MVMVEWPKRDQQRMSAAPIAFLNARLDDASLPAADRADLGTILEALRSYVRANDLYWDVRKVDTEMRFDGWKSPTGEGWEDPSRRDCDGHGHHGR
jgi:hypothetical protein